MEIIGKGPWDDRLYSPWTLAGRIGSWNFVRREKQPWKFKEYIVDLVTSEDEDEGTDTSSWKSK